MNYQALNIELKLPEFNRLSAAQCAQLLNASGHSERVYVNREDAINWLLKNGVWDKLEQASTNSAYPEILRARIRTFFATLQNISLLNFENFESDIPVLIAAEIISQHDADGFMALSQQLVPRWEQLVAERDIQIAWLVDKAELVRAKLAFWNGVLSDLESGIDVEFEGVS